MQSIMETEKWKVFLSKTIAMFFFQGCMKGLGVILNDTVRFVHSGVPLVSWSFTFMEGIAFLFATITSRLLDYFSSRMIVAIGGFLTGIGFFCEGLLARNIYLLFVSNIITGCGFGLIMLPTTVSLANSFGSSYGTALSFAGLISNTGMMLLPPIIERFRETYGLSDSVVLLGALMWNQILCGILLPVNTKHYSAKTSAPHHSDNKHPENHEITKLIQKRNYNSPTLPSSLKPPAHPAVKSYTGPIRAHPSLIFLFSAQFFHLITFMAWSMFLVPFGVFKGQPNSQAVILSIVGGTGVTFGRIVTIAVFHFRLMNSVPIIITPMVLLAFLFVACAFMLDFIVILVLSFAIGVCVGSLASWLFAYIKYSACERHFKSAVAWSNTCIGVGVFLTGLVSGLVHDIRNSYNDVFVFLALLVVGETVFTIPAIILSRTDCRNVT